MTQTAAFSAFLNLYYAVLSSEVLTLAEKTAAIEAACDEYDNGSIRPAAYKAIVHRLAVLPPKEPHAPSKVPQETPAAPKEGRAKPVVSRAGR